MKFGSLDFTPALQKPELLAKPTADFIGEQGLADATLVSAIDSTLSDTAAFCEAYDISPSASANCVIIEARRGDVTRYAACVIKPTMKVDVNGVVRRHLEARKISFAALERATSLTGMEYGGITPLGLPADWPILVDQAALDDGWTVIGSGIRGSKILFDAKHFESLPNITVLDIAKH